MLIKRLVFPLILLTLFSIFSPTTFAQTPPITVGANLAKYVPPTESECDISVPLQYSTIQAGIDAANLGNTICVSDGTYNENVIVNKSIRLAGSGFNRSIINGQAPGFYTIFLLADNVVVEGFFIQGVGDYPWAPILMADFHSGTIIRYNWVVAAEGEMAIRIDDPNNNVLIQNNIFEGHNSYILAAVPAPRSVRSDRIDFLNNTFSGSVSVSPIYQDTGRVLSLGSANSLVKQNVFNTTGEIREIIATFGTTNIITENNLNSVALIKVKDASGTLSAENNWWGDLDPSDNIWGDVDFTPFALIPFPEYPIPSLNQTPIANAGLDQTVIVNELVTLDGSGSNDQDGDPLTYLWSEENTNPQVGVLSDTTSVGPSFTPIVAGTYVFTLVVNDSKADSASDTVVITVQTPSEAIADLITIIENHDFQNGTKNSLNRKLDAALSALSDLNENNNVAALNLLHAFINTVEARRGNKITNEQADVLIEEAQAIINSLSI